MNKNEYLNKMNNRIFEYLSNKDKECTFQPKINNIYNNNDNLEVCERLYNYQYKYKENLNLIKNKYSNFTFKPKISENTDIILNKKNFIKNIKEYIDIRIHDKNLLLNKSEKEEKLKENNKNIEKMEELDNIEKNKNKFGSYNSNNNIYVNNNIKDNDNNININDNYIYNNNLNTDNNDNNYCNSNDFKVFLINNEKNKESDTRNNKKLMDFEYYNNIL